MFGKRLLELRTAKGITQTEFGNAVGLTRSAVSMLEKENRKPSLEVLEATADYFNVPIDYLLGNTSLDYAETKLLDYFRLCEDTQKEMILNYAKFIAKRGYDY